MSFPKLSELTKTTENFENNFSNYKAVNITKIENIHDKNDKELYLNTLSAKELKSYAIANSFLKDTFQLEKSNGFIEWKKLRKTSPIIIQTE
jgi:hypothetical protein